MGSSVCVYVKKLRCIIIDCYLLDPNVAVIRNPKMSEVGDRSGWVCLSEEHGFGQNAAQGVLQTFESRRVQSLMFLVHA